MRVLVLNADYSPIHIISEKRAIVIVFAEKADVVEVTDKVYHSSYVDVPVPSVIRLREYKVVPYHRRVALTTRAVLRRDDRVCAYCGGTATTVDHVIPRSRGGRNSWENVVACCRRCNSKKADKLLSEIGWHCSIKPYEPKGAAHFAKLAADSRPEWKPYFAPYLRNETKEIV